jgi:ATP-dependent RNA helicase RhlE
MNFRELGLTDALARRCESLGYTEPTPIQKQAIPIVLQGSDLIATAETGTGKTAAFLLPIIEQLTKVKKQKPATTMLVLSPTRELATQIHAACKEIAPKHVTCASVIGGVGYNPQITALKKRPDILIATPGRLLDHIESGNGDLKFVTTFVLDEADRMLDMGFLPAMKRIVGLLPKDRQTLFFSATMSNEIERVAHAMLRDPEYVSASPRGTAAATIKQVAYPVADHSKLQLLLDLLENGNLERVLVFTRTKRGADRVAHILEKRDHSSNRIHGDRSQSQRDSALRAFKAGQTNVLVATDVAARGIDIDSVGHVINYDIPVVPEDYVHRIGRTGRAGKEGSAITLFTLAEEHSMRAIERLMGQPVERVLREEFGGHATPAASVFKKGAAPARRSFGRRRR